MLIDVLWDFDGNPKELAVFGDTTVNNWKGGKPEHWMENTSNNYSVMLVCEKRRSLEH